MGHTPTDTFVGRKGLLGSLVTRPVEFAHDQHDSQYHPSMVWSMVNGLRYRIRILLLHTRVKKDLTTQVSGSCPDLSLGGATGRAKRVQFQVRSCLLPIAECYNYVQVVHCTPYLGALLASILLIRVEMSPLVVSRCNQDSISHFRGICSTISTSPLT